MLIDNNRDVPYLKTIYNSEQVILYDFFLSATDMFDTIDTGSINIIHHVACLMIDRFIQN